MIVDHISQWPRYFAAGSAWERAFAFLQLLGPDSAEGDFPIDGERLFGRVMSYATRDRGDAVLETHLQFIDIQTVLVGAEGIDWHPAAALEIQDAYDAAKDVTFYRFPGPGPAHICVSPGLFVVLFPEDAHMAQLLTTPAPVPIKKAVVKLRVDFARDVTGA